MTSNLFTLFFSILAAMLLLAPAGLATVHHVDIGDDFFSPAQIIVSIGDTVRWTHIGTEGEPHTTTSRDDIWDSGPLSEGDTFEFRFSDTGRFSYFCFFHIEIMHGAVIVTDGIQEVSIGDDFFAPAAITVNVGDVVRWTHIGTEGEPHTTTSRGHFWNSGSLFEGDTFEFQFNDIGRFSYFCFFHSAIMHGFVEVTDAGISKAAAESNSETGLTISAQDVARETRLLGNYPNPFNPSTSIQYTLAKEAYVTLKVYNTLGQEIATLANEVQTAGDKSAVWNGTNQEGAKVSSGIYIYRIQADDFVRTQRMILMK